MKDAHSLLEHRTDALDMASNGATNTNKYPKASSTIFLCNLPRTLSEK